MILQFPYSATKVVPDNSHAEVINFRGGENVLIDRRYFMPYTKWGYDYFCKDAGYMDYTDMIPEGVTEKPIHTMESLLAYAYNFKERWQDIEAEIKYHYSAIAELSKLKGEL